MIFRGVVIAVIAMMLIRSPPARAELVIAPGFPNEPQTPGAILSGLNAPQQGRTSVLAYHNGVLFTVPEDNLQAISKRLQAGAVLPATALDRSGANKLADGTLATFDSQIDPTTGTIKLRAMFPNEQRALYPNQFVNVRLLLDTHKNVTTMSTAGIQRGVPGTFVYLVNPDSTVSVRPVQLGITDGDRVEVLSGISPGDRVVIDGADKLRDGAKIAMRNAADAGNAPGAPAAGQSGANNGGENHPNGGKKRRSDGGQKQQ